MLGTVLNFVQGPLETFQLQPLEMVVCSFYTAPLTSKMMDLHAFANAGPAIQAACLLTADWLIMYKSERDF